MSDIYGTFLHFCLQNNKKKLGSLAYGFSYLILAFGVISSQPGAGETYKTHEPQPYLPGSNVVVVKFNFHGCSPPVSWG